MWKTIKSIETVETTCKKCMGKGQIEMYRYYLNGVCFNCDGGFVCELAEVERKIWVETEEERDAEKFLAHVDMVQLMTATEEKLNKIIEFAKVGIFLQPDEVILSA